MRSDGARRRHLHFLGAAVGVLHRPVGEHGADCRDRLDDDVDLTAEAAADRAADEPQLVEGDAKDQRHVVEREIERLRVGVDGDAAVALGLGDAAGRLGRRMLDGRGIVAVLYDVVRRSECLVDVAKTDAPAIVAFVDEVVGAVLLEVRRRHRFFDVEHGGEVLVVDHDAASAFQRCLRALGQNRTDLLAHEQDPVLRQHRLVIRANADQLEDRVPIVGHILMGEDADHARHLQRSVQVELLDQRVMARRAHHLEVQHAGETDILIELRAAGDVAARVGALDALSDHR